MTAVCYADDEQSRIIRANLLKLENIREAQDITDVESVVRDLALIKVRTKNGDRAEVMQLAETFRARCIHLESEQIILEITGSRQKIRGLVDVLKPYGIEEMVHCGAVALSRNETLRKSQSTDPIITEGAPRS